MSLILNFEICQTNACKDLVFSETTGVYDATYNIGGYGTPNIETTDVLTAVLTITDPTGTNTDIDLFTHGFPQSDITADGYTITSTTALPDGKYLFTYTITTLTETYTKVITQLICCQSECCVTQMRANLNLNCDACDKVVAYQDYLKAWTFLESLKAAATCGDVTSFTSLLKVISKLCKNNDCKTCK